MPAHWTLIGGALLVLASEPGPLSEERATVARDRALAVGTGCGGDAYSFAEVLPSRGSRGPVQVVPARRGPRGRGPPPPCARAAR
ncbi:MAG TPA: hypothetical protein VEA41_02510, partial [Salinarimonas sp.]|nr:hypothetical protein [Salinarimonas sp.]